MTPSTKRATIPPSWSTLINNGSTDIFCNSLMVLTVTERSSCRTLRPIKMIPPACISSTISRVFSQTVVSSVGLSPSHPSIIIAPIFCSIFMSSPLLSRIYVPPNPHLNCLSLGQKPGQHRQSRVALRVWRLRSHPGSLDSGHKTPLSGLFALEMVLSSLSG